MELICEEYWKGSSSEPESLEAEYPIANWDVVNSILTRSTSFSYDLSDYLFPPELIDIKELPQMRKRRCNFKVLP